MPIFHDPTEARRGSRLPDYALETSRPVPRLEEMSGADIVVSTLEKPPRTRDLLVEHVQSGCLLIQRKSGQDLPASLTDRRLFHSLYKMMDLGARMPQRVLLTTGIFAQRYGLSLTEDASLVVGTIYNEPDADPSVIWKYGHMSWDQFVTSLDKMSDRGMRIVNLPEDADIADYLKMKERHLAEYADRNVKILMPIEPYPDQIDSNPDALQLPIVVKDWRLTLSTVPGFGEAKCEALRAFAPSAYVWPILSNPLNVGKYLPPGIGPGLVEKFRRHFQVPDDLCYELVPVGHWQHCGVHNILFPGERVADIEEMCPLCAQEKTDPKRIDDIDVVVADPIPGNGAEIDEDDIDADPPWDTED